MSVPTDTSRSPCSITAVHSVTSTNPARRLCIDALAHRRPLDRMFRLKGIKHRYGSRPVLELADWSAEQGEHLLVLGPSGSGKTTLLHIIAGLLRPSQGSVTVAQQNLQQLDVAALDRFRGQYIGIVFQRLHLLASLTVLDNLLLAQYLAGVPQDKPRLDTVLTNLDLAEKRGAYPHELSHGEAQRVALARALVNRPKIILADEPTSNLDDIRCQQVLDLLEEQARNCQATLVIATHDQRIKQNIANRLELKAVS